MTSASYESLRFDVDDGLASVTFARSGRPNALDRTAILELAEVAHVCSVAEEVRAVLLTAEGSTFSVGGDMDWFLSEPSLPLAMKQMTTHIHTTVSRFARMPKPVVVAVNGLAAGGGLGLALMGDICLAARSARFSMAYIANGLTPDAGTTWFLPRLVGMRKAAELTLTKRTLSSEEALEWGLVSRVFPDADLEREACEFARTLSRGATASIGHAKSLLRRSMASSLEEQLEEEAMTIALTIASRDAQEGITAFREGRDPRYLGA